MFRNCLGYFECEYDGKITLSSVWIIRQVVKEARNRDSVVSEIIDCDNKTLPDVIPANVSSALSPLTTDCDITANLVSIDMDTTEDDERWKSSCTNMDLTNESLSENLDGRMLHVDTAKSVEEKRSEFYTENNTEETLRTSENENSTQSEVLRCEDNVNHNNSMENVASKTPELELPKADEIRIPCESNEDDDTVAVIVESDLSDAKTEHAHIHLGSSSDFNSFQYWRTPIPQVEEDISKLKVDNIAKSDSCSASQNENLHENNSGLTQALSDSLTDLSVCDNESGSVMSGPSEGVEHDLQSACHGQGETTVTVIDGVVQGTDLWNGKCFTLYASCSSFIYKLLSRIV